MLYMLVIFIAEIAALARLPIVLGQVRSLEFHFANAMTAGRVMFVWHG